MCILFVFVDKFVTPAAQYFCSCLSAVGLSALNEYQEQRKAANHNELRLEPAVHGPPAIHEPMS
jgi:hypothetical protein